MATKMWSFVLVGFLVLGTVQGLSFEAEEQLKLVNYVNEVQDDWEATTDVEFTMEVESKFLKYKPCHHSNTNETIDEELTAEESEEFLKLPKSYDVRKTWGKKCPSTVHIGDQASCGACWAFGSSEAMSDRICIKSNGKTNVKLSAAHLTACDKEADGCDGAHNLDIPYDFYRKTGIVSGGDYLSNEGCWPFPNELVSHTPTCVKKCRKGYKTPFNKDKHYGKKQYHPSGEKKMMLDIYKNGPISVGFIVYADFMSYSGGVYRRKSGIKKGGHAVKILGWGTSKKGTPYWIAANSWGKTWGEKGYFRFKRGSDECKIESMAVVAGLPK